MAAPVEVTLPPINQPLFDKATGLVTEPWYRYFESSRDRTGGDIDLVAGTAGAAEEAVGTANEAAQSAGTADGKAQTAQATAEGLAAALSDTDAEVYDQGQTLIDHEARIAALEAVVFP